MRGQEKEKRTVSEETALGADDNIGMVLATKDNIGQEVEAVKEHGLCFGGELSIDEISHIERDEETGSFHVAVENNGCELILCLRRAQLIELIKMIAEQLMKEDDKPYPVNTENRMSNVYVLMEDESISVDICPQQDNDENPDTIFPAALSVKDSKGQELRLAIDLDQARLIQEKLGEFVAIDGAFSGIRKN